MLAAAGEVRCISYILKSTHVRYQTMVGVSAEAVVLSSILVGSSVQASAEVPKASSQSKGGVTPDRWLFEPVHGLPIVRKQLK